MRFHGAGHCNDLPDLDVREALVLVDVRGPGVGFRLQSSWFGNQGWGSGFRVQGLGFRVWDSRFRVKGSEFRV